MAHRIPVISILRPRIDLGKTVQNPELLRSIPRATSLVEGTLDPTINELRDNIIEICRSGRAVKIEGLGTWTPKLSLDGTLSIQYRPDAALVKALKVPGTFTGRLVHKENIGKTGDELVAQWNEDYSDNTAH
jgi:hypothetical protein